MTMPDVSVPRPLGAAKRPPTVGTADRAEVHRSRTGPSRTMRDLTPFLFLAMILIPSLIILALAIADPGATPSSPEAPEAITAIAGS